MKNKTRDNLLRTAGYDLTIPVDGGVVVGDKISIGLGIEAVLQK